jgi:hypothetical protein
MTGYRIELSVKAKQDMLDIHAYIAGDLQEPNTADSSEYVRAVNASADCLVVR